MMPALRSSVTVFFMLLLLFGSELGVAQNTQVTKPTDVFIFPNNQALE